MLLKPNVIQNNINNSFYEYFKIFDFQQNNALYLYLLIVSNKNN